SSPALPDHHYFPTIPAERFDIRSVAFGVPVALLPARRLDDRNCNHAVATVVCLSSNASERGTNARQLVNRSGDLGIFQWAEAVAPKIPLTIIPPRRRPKLHSPGCATGNLDLPEAPAWSKASAR